MLREVPILDASPSAVSTDALRSVKQVLANRLDFSRPIVTIDNVVVVCRGSFKFIVTNNVWRADVINKLDFVELRVYVVIVIVIVCV